MIVKLLVALAALAAVALGVRDGRDPGPAAGAAGGSGEMGQSGIPRAGATDRRPARRREELPSALRFHGAIAPIAPDAAARMTSWRPGCPVSPADLRRVTVTHWGFDGRVHQGVLVVHAREADAMLRVMRRLFEARFPIERMRPVERYGSDDARSMAANNTSAFNCRRVGGSATWSEHAYGRAIDVNPVQNPAVQGGVVSPPAGSRYADRSGRAPGMIHAGDAVVRAFAAEGWGWGGDWQSLADYQHFSATGR